METFFIRITTYDSVHNCYDTEIIDIEASNMKNALEKYKDTLPSYATITGVAIRY